MMVKPDFHPLDWEEFTYLPEADYDLVQDPYELEGQPWEWGLCYDVVIQHRTTGKHYIATIYFSGCEGESHELVDTSEWVSAQVEERVVKQWIPSEIPRLIGLCSEERAHRRRPSREVLR